MKGYIFFSVHEALFHELSKHLLARGVTELLDFCGASDKRARSSTAVCRTAI